MHVNFGPHLMIDMQGCDVEALSSLQGCFEGLAELPDLVSMTPITQPYVFPYQGKQPQDAGITGFVVIAESHISIHTFPERAYCFIDIFSCRDFDVEKALQYCLQWFKPSSHDVFRANRGRHFRAASNEQATSTIDDTINLVKPVAIS